MHRSCNHVHAAIRYRTCLCGVHGGDTTRRGRHRQNKKSFTWKTGHRDFYQYSINLFVGHELKAQSVTQIFHHRSLSPSSMIICRGGPVSQEPIVVVVVTTSALHKPALMLAIYVALCWGRKIRNDNSLWCGMFVCLLCRGEVEHVVTQPQPNLAPPRRGWREKLSRAITIDWRGFFRREKLSIEMEPARSECDNRNCLSRLELLLVLGKGCNRKHTLYVINFAIVVSYLIQTGIIIRYFVLE